MTNIKLTSIQFEMVKELGKKHRPSPLKPDLMVGKLIEQSYKYSPKYVCINNEQKISILKNKINPDTKILRSNDYLNRCQIMMFTVVCFLLFTRNELHTQ